MGWQRRDLESRRTEAIERIARALEEQAQELRRRNDLLGKVAGEVNTPETVGLLLSDLAE